MLRQIALDTETTGLDPDEGHRIIEIGCVEIINRRRTQNHFHVYVNPGRSIDVGALAVHGINGKFLRDKPSFSDILENFLAYIQDAELIIHNAPFDVGFLNSEIRHAGKSRKPISAYCTITDTLKMARQQHPGQRNSLDALCKRYQIDSRGRSLHGALIDADLLAQVYLKMTGGQGELFGDDLASEKTGLLTLSESVSKENSLETDLPNIVLPASEAERLAHENYCKKHLADGSSLWEN